MVSIPQKRCTKCTLVKPLAEFGKDKYAKDGYTVHCKTCRCKATKRWQQTHIEYRSEYGRQWREDNREYDRTRKAVWYQKSADQQKERVRLWRKNNPDKRRAQITSYRLRNPDKVKTIWQRRRARRYAQGGSYSEREWMALKAQYDYTCLRCGHKEPEITLTPDHIIPIARGGSSFIGNIQPLCGPCNQWKSVRTIDFR